MGDAFRGIAVNSAGLGGPAIAIAAARAGGIGVLDIEQGSDPAVVRGMVDQLLAGTSGEVGLRFAVGDITQLSGLTNLFANRPHWLIVYGETAAALNAAAGRLPANAMRRLLVEVTDIEQLAGLDTAGISGFIARGHEAGGWVGEDSTFILLQKLLGAVALPVYAQGGVGMHGAAACRAAGAAGVVLDDQLLLMPESPLSADWKRQLAACKGQETRAVGERLGMVCRVLARPGLAGAARLQELADRIETAESGAAQWRRQAAAIVGWGPPEAFAWPVGQAIQLAAEFRDRYKTTGRLIQAMISASSRSVALAARLRPLAPGAPLAASHGTCYPIVQVR